MNLQFPHVKIGFCTLLLITIAVCIAGCKSPAVISQGGAYAIGKPVFSTPECTVYDNALISSVMKNWDELLRKQKIPTTIPEKVIIKFELHSDGTIKKLKIVEGNAGDAFTGVCIAAINENAPFPKWPDSMYEIVKAHNHYHEDYREFTLNFVYPNRAIHPN